MMKKIILSVGLALGLLTAGAAQKIDVKFNPISNPQPETLHVWQDTGMRTGLAIPLAGIVVNNKTLAEVCGWTLTDTTNLGRSLYVGLGLSVPLYKDSHLKFSLAAGWSTSLSRMTLGEAFGVRRADGYAVGFQLAYRF